MLLQVDVIFCTRRFHPVSVLDDFLVMVPTYTTDLVFTHKANDLGRVRSFGYKVAYVDEVVGFGGVGKSIEEFS